MTPVEETTRRQQLAATPTLSAFVLANAGSGKTRVLTNRVARLLLDDVRPDHILCITYTKAAAAEMSSRLFETLGDWALLDDGALQDALDRLEGDDARERTAVELSKARRLFARALETPGGLKIQTIHAFCESVLRRFPAEAGFAPGFTVLDDLDAEALFTTAIDRLIREASSDATFADNIAHIIRLKSEGDIRKLLEQQSGVIGRAVAAFGGPEAYADALRAEFDIRVDDTTAAIIADGLRVIDVTKLRNARDPMLDSGGDPAKLVPHIDRFLAATEPTDKWAALQSFFMTGGGTPRKRLATQETEKIAPGVGDQLTKQQKAFVACNDRLVTLATLTDTLAFTDVAVKVCARYEKLKVRANAVDFDDLIDSTRRLLQSAPHAWVSYKLDQGVDHVLVDEAQDTSPEQWEVITALIDDYLAGAGAEDRRRSMFAVGDIKQSIYSFQGANAASFQDIQHALGKKLAARDRFENLPLSVSFRTTAPVLRFVDALFTTDLARGGLGDDAIRHDVKRVGEAGLVELWPLTPKREQETPDPWDAPLDATPPDNPADRLAERVAATISSWLDNGEKLESENRPIAPGDIMILVQSRSTLFRAVIRALGAAGVPIAGADRINLLEDPAIEDIVSYFRAVLTPSDDLSLAEILKSPFFDFTDDDLFDLCGDRPDGASLWGRLATRRNEHDKWRRACDEISAARGIAVNEGPFAFLQHILESQAPSGKRRLYERLTQSSQDALEELMRLALDYENANPRSARDFLHWLDYGQNEIKREIENTSDAVRIMTVHGAKGLEANIVFLLDGHRSPRPQTLGPLFKAPAAASADSAQRNLFVLAASAKSDCALSAKLREEAKRADFEEYRRLLYVAATRARDRLYVCGVESGNEKTAPTDKPADVQTWHALATTAFDALRDDLETDAAPFWPDGGETALRLRAAQTNATQATVDTTPAPVDAAPAWLTEPAAPETAPRRLSPSALLGEDDDDRFTPTAPAYSPAMAVDPYFRGRTLHRLLELLPDVDARERRGAADAILANLAPETDAATRAHWRDEVLTVLADEAFSAVFAPGSQAEASIAGFSDDGAPIFGQIDRLVVSDTRILVVDYKTNRPPPERIEAVDPAYLAQLAAYRHLLQKIYPAHKIECALLWTFAPRLMPAPPEMLDHAFARFTQRA